MVGLLTLLYLFSKCYETDPSTKRVEAMQYMGSKSRIAKQIIPIMVADAKANSITFWVEPFIGGGNLIDKVPSTFKRLGSDLNPHVVAALTAIRDKVKDLPKSLTEQEYNRIKGTPPEPITSWQRFVCSFGSKFEGGYARRKGSNDTTFSKAAVMNAEKQSPLLKNVVIIRGGV